MSKTIYLASPYGFSAQQKQNLLPEFVHALESLAQKFGSLLNATSKLTGHEPDGRIKSGRPTCAMSGNRTPYLPLSMAPHPMKA